MQEFDKHTEHTKGIEAPLAIDVNEVARLLSISPRHVHTLKVSGRLPAPNRLGRCLRWSAHEIRQWLDAGSPTRAEWEKLKSTAKGGRS